MHTKVRAGGSILRDETSYMYYVTGLLVVLDWLQRQNSTKLPLADKHTRRQVAVRAGAARKRWSCLLFMMYELMDVCLSCRHALSEAAQRSRTLWHAFQQRHAHQ